MRLAPDIDHSDAAHHHTSHLSPQFTHHTTHGPTFASRDDDPLHPDDLYYYYEGEAGEDDAYTAPAFYRQAMAMADATSRAEADAQLELIGCGTVLLRFLVVVVVFFFFD